MSMINRSEFGCFESFGGVEAVEDVVEVVLGILEGDFMCFWRSFVF